MITMLNFARFGSACHDASFRAPRSRARRRLLGNALLFLTLLPLGKVTAFAAINVVVPAANANVEGDSENAFPFHFFANRYQQIYSASEFPSVAGFITQIRFRPDSSFGRPFSAVLPNVRIALSVTAVTPATLSPIYANNVGSSQVVVFDGTLPLSSAFTGPQSGPKDFDAVIKLSTPFFYNPAQGNLLLEVKNSVGVFTTYLDAVSTVSVNRVFSIDPNAAIGSMGGARGLVTEFIINPCSATLCITDYTLVNQQAAAAGRVYATYRADLVNNWPPVPVVPPGTSTVTATLINLDPFKVRAVPGQDQLKFSAVLNNYSVSPSSNTFTVIIDPAVPFDPNLLEWMFQIGPAPPVANPGPNLRAPVGSTVTVNGSGSSNPSGIGGALTYFWMFTSRPPGTNTRLLYETTPAAMFVADAPGTYVLTLTVSNGASSSSSSVTVVAQ